MRFRSGEFSTGTTGNFHPELTLWSECTVSVVSAAFVEAVTRHALGE